MRENKKIVSVITATYNGLIFIKPWLASLEKQTYKNIEIIAVDNNSSDGTVKFLEKNYPEVIIIKNKINNGFAEANNQGSEIAKGEYLFLVNNDTELFTDTIEKLVEAHKAKTILTAFQIPSRNRKAQGRAGGGMDIFGYPFVDHANLKKTRFFYADGAALFVSKKDFMEIGMFDKELFMFQEDIDFSWRAQIMGYKVKPCWESKIYHYYGGTAKVKLDSKRRLRSSYFRRYYNDRNVMRNMLKNYSLTFLIPLLALLILFYFAEMLLFLFLRDLRAVNCYINGLKWNLANLKDTLRLRKEVQSKRRVSDWTITNRMYWQYSKLLLFLKFELPRFQD